MDEIIEILSDTSSKSVIEIGPPEKLPPPLIDLGNEEIVLNIEKTPPHVFMMSNNPGDENVAEVSPHESADESADESRDPNHWTLDMKKFYNEAWGGEDKFIVQKLQDKMEKTPSLWTVSPKDLQFETNIKVKPHLKCWNCSQFGHTQHQCPEERQIVKCHMCGGAGHIVDSCPNSKCLNCGNQTNSYVLWCNKCEEETYKQCTRCSLYGHYYINCSDNWRRYHSTVGKINIDQTQNMMYKPDKEMWCCNCSKRGHNQINCPKQKAQPFPDTFPFVASYDGTTFSEHRPRGVKRGKYHESSSSKFKRRKMQHYSKEMIKRGKSKRRDNSNSPTHSRKYKRKGKRERERERSRPSRKMFETPDFIPI